MRESSWAEPTGKNQAPAGNLFPLDGPLDDPTSAKSGFFGDGIVIALKDFSVWT
jgi:hypothetical protein